MAKPTFVSANMTASAPGGPIRGGNLLAPGVIVGDIRTEQNHYSDHIDLIVTLLVSPQQFGHDALNAAMQSLGLIFQTAYEKLGEPQDNGAAPSEESEQEETEDLRGLIERRFDEVDQALRLLVDP